MRPNATSPTAMGPFIWIYKRLTRRKTRDRDERCSSVTRIRRIDRWSPRSGRVRLMSTFSLSLRSPDWLTPIRGTRNDLRSVSPFPFPFIWLAKSVGDVDLWASQWIGKSFSFLFLHDPGLRKEKRNNRPGSYVKRKKRKELAARPIIGERSSLALRSMIGWLAASVSSLIASLTMDAHIRERDKENKELTGRPYVSVSDRNLLLSGGTRSGELRSLRHSGHEHIISSVFWTRRKFLFFLISLMRSLVQWNRRNVNVLVHRHHISLFSFLFLGPRVSSFHYLFIFMRILAQRNKRK